MNHKSAHESPIDHNLRPPPPGPMRTSVSRTKAAGAHLSQNRGMVLAILFGVTGALGIPLLWMNKRFSTLERVFWSIVLTIYTSLLIGGTLWVLWWAYRVLTEAW